MKRRVSSADFFAAPAFLSLPGMTQVVLVAIVILANLQMLTFGFVYDDNENIIRNLALASSHPGSHARLNAVLSGNVALFRPVTGWWMQLNVALFGLHPLGWHVSSIVLHVIITLLVFALAVRLLQDQKSAFAVSLIFAVHPTHVENVAWVSAANDLLMSVFLLGSFLLFLRYREQRAPILLCASVILSALGLLSKETAVVFPFIVLTYAFAFANDTSMGSVRRLTRAAAESAAYFVMLAFYVAFRIWSLRGVTSGGASGTVLSWKTTILTWPSVLWFEFSHIVAPTRLSEFYPGKYVDHLDWRGFALPLVLLSATFVAVVYLAPRIRNARLAVFAFGVVVLPLIPTLYLKALTPGDFLHDRFLYLSTLGFAIVLVLILQELPGININVHLRTTVLVLVVAAELIGYVMNARPWKNDALLCENGLHFVPGSSKLRDNMASGLVLLGRRDEAIKEYREVLSSDPKYWRSYYNLGLEYLKEGRFAQGAEILLRGIEVDPSDSRQFIMLAAAQLKMNDLISATRSAQEAIRRAPRATNYHAVLGDIYFARGDLARSLSEYREELALDPASSAASAGIQRIEATR